MPLHLQPAFSSLGYTRGQFPVTESATEQILSLPLFAELADQDIERICSLVNGLA
jgi:dTDP-4-amino-4,6-dideoxygalactose transaminase